jgi:hypothetical protein
LLAKAVADIPQQIDLYKSGPLKKYKFCLVFEEKIVDAVPLHYSFNYAIDL